MDAVLEQINSSGKAFIDFALPMLIQSSVLIVVLLGLDLILRKRIRAVFRYWIWMIVLVKLTLPTTLALPTSPAYWFSDDLHSLVASKLFTAEPSEAISSAARMPPESSGWPKGNMGASSREKADLQTGPVPSVRADGVTTPALPASSVTWQGSVFLVWLTAVAVMMILFIQRAFLVRSLVAQSEEAGEAMIGILQRASRQMQVNAGIGLRLSQAATRPSVCGIVRPTILIPQSLPGKMALQDFRSILLHELAHIKRGDLWVSFIQTIVQILYIYNPLLWVANAAIRKVREQAADEMVLVALGEEADDYPKTLLDVSRLTFGSPALSLRFIGVAESKKALHRRIKHMLTRPVPQSAKIGVLGMIAIIVVAAVLLPMARAEKSNKDASATPAVTATEATEKAPPARAVNLPPTDSADANLVFDNPTNLGPSVNSSSQEYDPSISADELEFYFNSDRPGGLGKTDLWVATRKTKADPWGKAVNLGPTVNSPAGDKGPCISADGLSLYFSSDRPGGYSGLDLWVTTRESKTAPWGAPVNLGPTVNSPADEFGPSLSTDGLELYFSSHWGVPETARPGGSGESDLWVTRRKTTADPWGTPVNLGPTVNSPLADASPSISGDGLSLYFQSDRPKRHGADWVSDVDRVRAIWVTQRKSKSDPWGMPVKLGPGVNAYYYTTGSLGISKDASTLYFSCWGRPGGIGRSDIWQVTLAKSTPESRAQYQLAASLYDAVTAGDLQQVRSLLAKGANANVKDGLGNTALFFAILSHDPAMVELLVTKGADVNLADVFRTAVGSYSLLQLAVGHGSLDTMRLLVDHGAKLDAKDQDGWTALRHAAAGGKRDLVEFFVSKGVDLPAFHLAACMGDLTRVKGLLEQGANVDATDELGWTPLSWATCLRRTEVAKLLVANGANVQVVAKDGTTPLLGAVQREDRELVDLILSKGADVNTKDKQGTTMLCIAAAYGHRELAELLIAKGADVNAGAMGWALANDRVAIAKMLAAKGAEGVTLPVAARIGDLAKVKSLLEQGADVNAEDFRGATALHYAARGGFQEMVEVLLAKGANVKAIAYGSSAAEHALGNGHPEIVELLIAKGAPNVPLLHLAVHKRNLAQVRDLLEKGADVNQRTQHGTAPLDVAARAGLTEIAALLLDKGANVNAADNRNWTPLHDAARNGHKDVVELLIAKGGEVNARDGKRRTPLWYAREKAHSSVVDLLQKHGAKE